MARARLGWWRNLAVLGGRAPRRTFMTLMELVLVLAILAVTASLTLSLFERNADDDRLKRTLETGHQIQEALRGRPGQAGAFLADMGRWPKFSDVLNMDGVDSGQELCRHTVPDYAIVGKSLASCFADAGVDAGKWEVLGDFHAKNTEVKSQPSHSHAKSGY